MRASRPILGPRSKYDRSLPYLYEARVDILGGQAVEPLYNYYQADTICLCTAEDGTWLERPGICRVLEARYRSTLEGRYKGHVAGAV